jgi:N-acetylglucosamine-6-sulfatase
MGVVSSSYQGIKVSENHGILNGHLENATFNFHTDVFRHLWSIPRHRGLVKVPRQQDDQQWDPGHSPPGAFRFPIALICPKLALKMTFEILSILALVPGLVSAALYEKKDHDSRPNILYIMSDDHAAQEISAYVSRLAGIAPTPTIDRLAKEGALFKNAFCTNAICSPSRACVLTGQYKHTNNAFDLAGRVLPGKQTLAIEFGKSGYHTAMIGKWHLKDEPADYQYHSVLAGQGRYLNLEFRIRGEKKWGKNTVKYEGKHSTDVITDITLDWLKEGWDQEKPFFLMHHYKAPRDHFENAPRYENFLKHREAALKAEKRNIPTHKGHTEASDPE